MGSHATASLQRIAQVWRYTSVFMGLILIWTSTGACRSVQMSKSELTHEVDRPILDRHPFQWASVTDEEYQSVLMYGYQEEFNLNGPGIATPEHPARQRLQFHMDRIDEMLRLRHPDEFALIPRPKAQLILTAESNAVVYAISLCLDRSASLPQLKGKGSSRFWQFSRENGLFDVDSNPDRPVLCLKRALSDGEIQGLLEWNLPRGAGCPFTWEGSSLLFGSGCRELFSKARDFPSRADNLVVMTLPNVVTFYAGLLQEMSEDQLVFWIAHELGHYYRAHDIIPASNFGVYYRLSDRNPGQRPKQSEELASFGFRMEELRLVMEDDGLAALNKQQRAEWSQLNQKAYQEKIGQYTKEQEADELALEWVIDYGLDPELPLRALLHELQKSGDGYKRRPQPSDEWDYARCQSAFASAWKTESEGPIFVPVGDYLDEHHSLCYRAFNLYREIETHAYPNGKPTQKRPEFLSPELWQQLQVDLSQDVAKVQSNQAIKR